MINNIPNVFRNIALPFQKASNSYAITQKTGETRILKNGNKQIIPNGAQIWLGKTYTLDTRNPQISGLIDKRGSIIIGSNSNCNIPVDSFYNGIAPKHAQLTKTQDGICVQCLSDRGMKVVSGNDIKPFLTGVENLPMSQGNIGDCYLLATIYALSHNTKGQEMLKNMVNIDKDGNYIVTFKNQKPICVKPDELDGETYNDGTVKYSVAGDLSLRAIERAYAKLIRKPYNNFNMQQLNMGGYPEDALYTLTGIEADVLPAGQGLESILKKPAAETANYILLCSTPSKGNFGRYMDSEKRFISAHAYAMKSIDAKNKTVEIVDPHDTRVSETISLDEFKNMFDCIYYAKI